MEKRIVPVMASLPKYKITIVVVPDKPDMTTKEIRDWVEIIVRGIGAVTEIDIEPEAGKD